MKQCFTKWIFESVWARTNSHYDNPIPKVNKITPIYQNSVSRPNKLERAPCRFSTSGLECNSRLPQATGGRRGIDQQRNNWPDLLLQADRSLQTVRHRQLRPPARSARPGFHPGPPLVSDLTSQKRSCHFVLFVLEKRVPDNFHRVASNEIRGCRRQQEVAGKSINKETTDLTCFCRQIALSLQRSSPADETSCSLRSSRITSGITPGL